MSNLRVLWAFAAVGLVGLIAQRAAGADADLPAGAKAVWDMSKASRQTTPTQERICINGLWRWQPASPDATAVPADNWGFYKVPGPWPGITSYIQFDSQTCYPHPTWRGVRLAEVTSAWYQREITVPASWKGRRIAVYTEYLNSYAAVYLDGTKAGDIYFPWGQADITPLAAPGRTQRLSLYVKAAPLAAVMKAFTDTNTPKDVKGRVERRGLCGDVWLVSTPNGPRIDDLRVDTSVRQWRITFNVALAGLKPDTQYSLRAAVTDGGRPAETFASPPFTAADLKEGVFSFSRPWHPAKLWDTITPQNMYDVQVTLSAAAEVVDVFRPVRFGFREFWAQGRDFYLNGTRFYCSLMGTENGLIGAAWSTYDAAKETFLRDQSFGINTVYTHNYGCSPGSHVGYDDLLRAADDTGMLISFSQPHYGEYHWTADTMDEAVKNGYARTAQFYCHAAANHPSVVFYSMNHNAYAYGGSDDPDLIDGTHDEAGKLGPRTGRGYRQGMFSQSVVAHYDPTRIIYHHSSGSLGAAYTLNLYLGWVPTQECCDWMQHWSEQGVQPFIFTEFDAPYDFDWTMYRGWYEGRRLWGSANMPWEYCVGEWNAQFLGDRAFNLAPSDQVDIRWEARKWKTAKAWHQWDYPNNIVVGSTKETPDKLEVRAERIARIWRAYRTWGVSATNEFGWESFWKLAKGVDPHRRVDFQTDWDRIQRPGFSPDFENPAHGRMDLGYQPSDWVPSAAAKALYRNNMPLLAYIAGKPQHFTAVEHDFLPGESFTAQLIIINNSRRTQDCDCSWSLALPSPIAGQARRTVATGEQVRIPLEFTLPAGTKAGSYEIAATVKFSGGAPQSDLFEIHVMPAVPAVSLPPRTAIFDPKGQTAKLLARLGVKATPVGADADLAGYDLLIVGREALSVDGPAPDISRLAQGLKVVLFEQTADVLEKRFGFRVQEYGLRNVFARMGSHPILAGLTADNLRDWRGQATLTPDRLTDYKPTGYGERLKKWCGLDASRPCRCGNWGNVASVLIEKPARGDFLPVVDGGFSLQFSPLMVYRQGQGMTVLCQMDVSGRTEDDPAADRIVANLLNYAGSWKPGPRRTVAYLGDERGKAFLAQEGLAPADYSGGKPALDQVLVVGPGSAATLKANAGDLAAWIKAGGHVLALGLARADAEALLPGRIKMTRAEHLSTVFPPQGMNSPLAGVGCADVMNRDPREFDLVAEGADILGDGILAVAADAHVVLAQMAPWQYDYTAANPGGNQAYNLKRTFRRTACLAARILGNLGVSAATPLAQRFSRPPASPTPWLDSFYLDKPQELDDPYRYFSW